MRSFKFLVCCWIGFVSWSAAAQDLERVDATIQLYPETFKTPQQLSTFISRDFIDSEEKVRAIYSWIINNIRYDPEEYKQFNYSFKNYRDRNIKEEKTRNKIIERTLQEGVAVCEGYAMLFEKLCELQQIPNYLVRGDIKSNFNDIGRPFKKSHMWNVVTLGEKSFLFDPTWGAGRYNGKFIKDPSYFYYKTPPHLLLKTHYPELFEDAFIAESFSRQDFADLPLIIYEELRIEDVITPKYGQIDTEAYFDEVFVEVAIDSVQSVAYSFGKEKRNIPEFTTEAGKLKFSVPLEVGAQQLLLYFNGKPALGYVLK